MARLTKDQRVDLVLMYARVGASLNEVSQRFHAKYPEAHVPSISTISSIVKKFKETGSVLDKKPPGRPRSSTDDNNATNVLAMYRRSPIKSQKKASAECGISRRSVGRILKLHHFHPYKVHLVQELNPEDFDRRQEFCGKMHECIEEDANFRHNIVFSDEATFHLNGHVNRHDTRYYAPENPHWMCESHSQVDPSTNVWCGIWNTHIIGPFFLHETMTSETYLALLETRIFPAIQQIAGSQALPWFQQDGAPPHFGTNVREWLNNHFIERWIGRRGAVEWPARSPDLTPLDFFLWGHLKSVVYNNRPRSLPELEATIEEECRKITDVQLLRVLAQWELRLTHCMMSEGHQFEHLL